MQQWRSEAPAMTFDEVATERSKGFVKALQELKSLRPQLYSAAEYCEKTYLHNEQKQMVLDNLKDYAVRALVNAVDHLGTVAYKLTDLFEQQKADVSTVELKISCLNQVNANNFSLAKATLVKKVFVSSNCSPTAQDTINITYSQQDSAIKGSHNSNQLKTNPSAPNVAATKTLLWHLASESNSVSNEASNSPIRNEHANASKTTPGPYRVADAEASPLPYTLSAHLHSSIASPAFGPVQHAFTKNNVDGQKHLSGFRSFDNPGRREIVRRPAKSKSMLSAFFSKNKYPKQRKALVS